MPSTPQESTASIQQIIEKLQSQSDLANKNMVENVELIQQSVLLAVSFEDISQTTTQTFDLVNQNVEAVQQTLQASAELVALAKSQKNELAYFKV